MQQVWRWAICAYTAHASLGQYRAYCAVLISIGTLRFIGRQRHGNGKKTHYDMCL